VAKTNLIGVRFVWSFSTDGCTSDNLVHDEH
jgi:hypothetical protein